MDLFYLTTGNLKDFRKEQYDNQEGICPILKQKVPFEDTVVDHKHSSKGEELGKNGAGEIRGIIHNYANSTEGRFLGIFKRSGLAKMISFPDYLRNLADYLENPPFLGSGIIHPSEKPKAKLLGKREFARVIKYWPQLFPKRKLPVYKEKMKLTKEWEDYIERANKIHYSKYI